MLFEFNVYSFLLLLGFLQGAIYLVLLLVRGRREDRRSDYWLAFLLFLCCLYIGDNFSDTEAISFSWLRNLLVVLISGLSVVLVIAAMDAWITPLDYKQFWVGHLAVAVTIYYLSIAGYNLIPAGRAPLAFSPEAAPLSPPPSVKEENDPELNAWTSRVEAYMQREQPHLNPSLTLQEMAAGLHTNSSVLSRVINQGFGQNFNDFINQRRVDVLKERLAQPDARHLTLLAIALESGFNSKATFNRAFRKFTGMAPGEFMAQVGKEG